MRLLTLPDLHRIALVSCIVGALGLYEYDERVLVEVTDCLGAGGAGGGSLSTGGSLNLNGGRLCLFLSGGRHGGR